MSKIVTRKSHNRLKGYDYTQSNYYCITTCTENREEWFGVIKNEKIILNEHGWMCQKCLENLPNYYNTVAIDTFIVMPNHVHAIIIINNHKFDNIDNGQALGLSLHNKSKSLSKIICDFKSFSAREINKTINNGNKFKWQRSFHDHIIRNEGSLNGMREYIINNPVTWQDDNENNASRAY